MLTIVADMEISGNSTGAMNPETTVNIQGSNDAYVPSANTVPLLAIIVCFSASCNSGTKWRVCVKF